MYREVYIMDLMCEDYERAKDNRTMVRLKRNIEGYLHIEQLVKNWPRNKLLPDSLLGNIPSLGKHESRNIHQYGIHEVNE